VKEKLIKGLLAELERKREVYRELIKMYEERLQKSLEEIEEGDRAKRSENEYLLAFYQKKLLEVEETIKQISLDSKLLRKESNEVLPWTAVELSNGLKVFIVPYSGGEKVEGFTIVSVDSPIYERLKSKRVGDEVVLPNGKKTKIKRIA